MLKEQMVDIGCRKILSVLCFAKKQMETLNEHSGTYFSLFIFRKAKYKNENICFRMYNLDKYLRLNNLEDENKQKLKICYCRVSSKKQEKDLKNQILLMEKKFPEHKIIKDIGSGLNMKRKGLKEIIEKAINGEIDELVITYKDRLARFGLRFNRMANRNIF